MTNADRIRAMTDEELVGLLDKAIFCGGLIERESTDELCHGCKGEFCGNTKEWLQSESEVRHGIV